jgi:membrane glycosyltransferase
MSLIRHLRLRKKIEPYLDGELDQRSSAVVAEHVRDCWYCSGNLQDLRLIRAALLRRSVEPPSLPLLRLRRFAQRIDGS